MKLPPLKPRVEEKKERVGVDIGLNWDGGAEDLAARVLPCCADGLELQMISKRQVRDLRNAAAIEFHSAGQGS